MFRYYCVNLNRFACLDIGLRGSVTL